MLYIHQTSYYYSIFLYLNVNLYIYFPLTKEHHIGLYLNELWISISSIIVKVLPGNVVVVIHTASTIPRSWIVVHFIMIMIFFFLVQKLLLLILHYLSRPLTPSSPMPHIGSPLSRAPTQVLHSSFSFFYYIDLQKSFIYIINRSL